MSKSITRTLGVFALVFITLLSGCTRLPDALVPKSDATGMANEPLKLLDNVPWGDYQKSKALDAYEIVKIKKADTSKIQSGAIIRADTLMPLESYYNKTSGSDNFKISTHRLDP